MATKREDNLVYAVIVLAIVTVLLAARVAFLDYELEQTESMGGWYLELYAKENKRTERLHS